MPNAFKKLVFLATLYNSYEDGYVDKGGISDDKNDNVDDNSDDESDM